MYICPWFEVGVWVNCVIYYLAVIIFACFAMMLMTFIGTSKITAWIGNRKLFPWIYITCLMWPFSRTCWLLQGMPPIPLQEFATLHYVKYKHIFSNTNSDSKHTLPKEACIVLVYLKQLKDATHTYGWHDHSPTFDISKVLLRKFTNSFLLQLFYAPTTDDHVS